MPAISSTFESHEPNLGEVLAEVGDGRLQLPDFQRPWVWDDAHIRSLIASVSLSYPIGAIMLLVTGGKGVRFRPRPVTGAKFDRPEGPARLILDGQQRLTSLFQSLWTDAAVQTQTEKKSKILRHYYLDIDVCLDPEADRLDAVLGLPPDRMLKSDFGRKVDLDVSSRTLEFDHGLVPLPVLMQQTQWMTWRTEFMKYHSMDTEQVDRITRFEQDVWMRFQQFKVPVIELQAHTPKEAVCQVFEKVNTGGVALTVFELMTATFAADDYQLRENWELRKERLSGQDVLSGLGGTDFLQAVTLLASYRRHESGGSAVGCKRRDILRLELEDYKACSDDVEEGFRKAGQFLATQHVFLSGDLPYRTQLTPLATICSVLGARFDEEPVRQRLALWYWCGVFGELYGAASETRFARDMQDVPAWILRGESEPRTVAEASFAPMRLLTLRTRRSAAYKGFYAFLVAAGSRDFINGDPIAHTQGFLLPVHIHHIFPAAWCKKQGLPRGRWDSIVNKASITQRTNLILSGHAPSRYLKRVAKDGKVSEDQLDSILESHLIAPSILRSDDFDGFMRDRAIQFLDIIEAATGKVVQGRDAEDVTEAFGGSLLHEAPVAVDENPAQSAGTSSGPI